MPSVALGTGADASGVLLERTADLSMLAECLEGVERSVRGHVLLVGGEAGSARRRCCGGSLPISRSRMRSSKPA
jgi:hypothetical protein